MWCSTIISCWNTNLPPLIPAWPASHHDIHLFLNLSSLSSGRVESGNVSCLMWIWCQQPLLTLLLPSASAPLLIPFAPASPSHSLLPWLCFIFRLTFWSFRPACLPLCSHSLEKIFFIVIKWKRGLLERAQASMCRLVCEEEEGRDWPQFLECSAPVWSLKCHRGLFLTNPLYVILGDAIIKSHLFLVLNYILLYFQYIFILFFTYNQPWFCKSRNIKRLVLCVGGEIGACLWNAIFVSTLSMMYLSFFSRRLFIFHLWVIKLPLCGSYVASMNSHLCDNFQVFFFIPYPPFSS